MTRLRVLIVEDDFAVAHVTRGFVERHPRYEVVGVASTGSEALRELRELDPDVVLLDVYLPDMSGITVLGRARAAGSRVEVIAVTAARDLDTVRVARAHGVHHYLVKPFPMHALHERLDDVWRAHERDAALAAAAELDQTAVDALMRRDALASAGQRKGVSPLTLERVAEALESVAEPVSAAELGEALGMSRVSARRYLERLVEAGLAARAPRYGHAGRPELLYSPRR
ncbi:response regulator [Microbacterium rhizophilus]|uniref:response regulator n=1 Tax=Microbacterium rhizophilus TaxID=3138934 RepID=UPI0031ED1DAA